MTQLENMNDVQFLAKKNAEITRLKLIQAVLIIIVILLAVVIAAIALLSRFSQPTPTPTLDVISRESVNGKDCKNLTFPKVVTAGKPFKYTTCGKKLVDADATVTYQLTCNINGAQQTTPLGTIYSKFPKGEFDRQVSSTIPVSTRILNSPKCRFISIPVYTFYQTDQGGNQRSFDVKEPIESTEFKLIVPEDAIQQLSNNGSSSATPSSARSNTPATPSDRQQVATTTPSGGTENTKPTNTTSGGAGGNGNGNNSGSDDEEDPAITNLLKLNLDAPLLPPIGVTIR